MKLLSRILAAVAFTWALVAVGAWFLMLLVPMLADEVGTPVVHPGYWHSVAVVALARVVRNSLVSKQD